MKTLNEQIAGKCIHFNGLGNKLCDAGIKYKDVEVKGARPIRIPCLKDSCLTGGECSKIQFPTDEEIAKQTEEIKAIGQKSADAYNAVKTHIDATGEMHGKIVCPSCGGNLHYTQAEVNGHIWGKCKCGISWME